MKILNLEMVVNTCSRVGAEVGGVVSGRVGGGTKQGGGEGWRGGTMLAVLKERWRGETARVVAGWNEVLRK